MKLKISEYLNKYSNINVVYPGIRDCFFNCNTATNSKNILSIGNIIPRKGYEWLIKSLSQLKFDWHLNIIGDYSIDKNYYQRLGLLIKNYKLEDKITFLGSVETEVFCFTVLEMGLAFETLSSTGTFTTSFT